MLYTKERWDRILTEQARGRFLTRIVRDAVKGNEAAGIPADPRFPSDDTIRAWADADLEMARDLAQARTRGREALFEEILDIADEAADDFVLTPQGPRFNKEAAMRSRIRIDARFKVLSILDRKFRDGPGGGAGKPGEDEGDGIARRTLAEYTEDKLVALYEALQKAR